MTKLAERVKTVEAASILGVAQSTLRKWAESGAIRVHREPANGEPTAKDACSGLIRSTRSRSWRRHRGVVNGREHRVFTCGERQVVQPCLTRRHCF